MKKTAKYEALHQKVLDGVGELLREAGISFEGKPASSGVSEVAVEFRLLSRRTFLAVEYYSALTPRAVLPAVDRMRGVYGARRQVGVCVRRMSWALLEACKEAGTALFDLEGNAYLRLPGVYIERLRPVQAQGRQPTSGTVFSARATRLARALLARHPEGWVQAELARTTGLSPGYVSTLAKRLIAQGYVSDRQSLLHLDDPERLLDDWAAHYRFDRHRKLSYAMSTHSYSAGMNKLGKALSASVKCVAWTGWTGAELRAPYATPTVFMAYVDAPPEKLEGVFPVESQGNVRLYVPQDAGVFQFLSKSQFGPIVSDVQLYLDLHRMPGRALEQADALRQLRLDFSGRTP